MLEGLRYLKEICEQLKEKEHQKAELEKRQRELEVRLYVLGADGISLRTSKSPSDERWKDLEKKIVNPIRGDISKLEGEIEKLEKEISFLEMVKDRIHFSMKQKRLRVEEES